MICPRCGNDAEYDELCFDNKDEAVACMLCEDDPYDPDWDGVSKEQKIEGEL